MKAKEILNEIRRRDEILALKMEELENLRLLCDVKSVNYDVERVQGSPTRENSAIIEYIQMKDEIAEYVAETIRMKRAVMTELDKFTNPQMVKIVYDRYFHGKTFEQIAEDLQISERRVQQLNGSALSELNRISQNFAKFR